MLVVPLDGVGSPDLTGVHVVDLGTLSNWQQAFIANSSSNFSLSLLKVTANCSAAFSYGFYFDSTTSQWMLFGNVVEGPGDNKSWGIWSAASGDTIISGSLWRCTKRDRPETE